MIDMKANIGEHGNYVVPKLIQCRFVVFMDRQSFDASDLYMSVEYVKIEIDGSWMSTKRISSKIKNIRTQRYGSSIPPYCYHPNTVSIGLIVDLETHMGHVGLPTSQDRL